MQAPLSAHTRNQGGMKRAQAPDQATLITIPSTASKLTATTTAKAEKRLEALT